MHNKYNVVLELQYDLFTKVQERQKLKNVTQPYLMYIDLKVLKDKRKLGVMQ